ncbi:MAG: sigma-70 factor domain-containing protein, partial [Nitrospiraceae bacterium]
MKQDELLHSVQAQDLPAGLDLDADDHVASDLLEDIERNSTESCWREPQPKDANRSAKWHDGRFAMESIYFRSFGEWPLLNRDEELALAKRIDHGSRAIRDALRAAVKIAARMRQGRDLQEAAGTLKDIRRLSGLSAIAVSEA